MTILGLDVSHYQGAPNWAQVKSSGREFVVLKATEGTTYVDPTFAASRRNAHAAGLIVGHYHFARGGNATAEAAWFVRTIGALQPGEFLVLDWEITYAGDHVAWCKAWLDAVTSSTTVAPLIYMNQTAMNAHNWMPLSGAHGLWLAKYDGSTVAPTACNCWPTAAMKQYSSTAAVPGVAGSCDVNAFYGTTAQLLAYGYQGADMPITDADAAVIWNHVLGQKNGLGPAPAYTWLQDTLAHAAAADSHSADARNAVVAGDGAGPGNNFAWLYNQEDPKLNAILDALGKVQAPAIDEAKLAAALLADPASVDRLGAAIAAHLKLSSS